MSNLNVTLNCTNTRGKARAGDVFAGEVVLVDGEPALMTDSLSREGDNIAVDLETGSSVFLRASERVTRVARARFYVDR